MHQSWPPLLELPELPADITLLQRCPCAMIASEHWLCAGWQPQGSAWKRYVAQASDAAAAFKGFGAARLLGRLGSRSPLCQRRQSCPAGRPLGQAA